MNSIGLCAIALLAALPAVASAAPLFMEDFNVDPTVNWTVNPPALTMFDYIADFYYDYSAIGVPAEPNGTGARGLKMTANNTSGVFSGFSVSPAGENFTGNYRLEFDLWQNYAGPLGLGGSGTTQLSTFGIGTSGMTAVWPGAATKESVALGATLDGGGVHDYRVYTSAAPTGYVDGSPIYAAPVVRGFDNRNSNHPYYVANFQETPSAPLAQTALFPNQTGETDPGEASFAWRRVAIEVLNDIATWSIDGAPMAAIDLSTVTLGGGNIFFGHSDVNASSSIDPNDFLLNVTLIDNITVIAIPEPATLSLVISVSMALVGRRRV